MSSLPPQTKYIVGNEACERFSFYGMRSILTLYMIHQLELTNAQSQSVMHGLIALNYTMPLLGGWIADRFLGRYRTILYVSLFYCLGHGVLAAGDLFSTLDARRMALYVGLLIIAMGAGGIKPSVSAFVGDQMKGSDKQSMTKAYAAFYWSLNLGSFFSFLVIPFVSKQYGYSWAFAIPGLAMGLATFIFWLGRKQYYMVAPQREKPGSGFFPVIVSAVRRGWSETTRRRGAEAVAQARNMLRILAVFAMVIPFWSLFDQTASSWVIQGEAMRPVVLDLGWLRQGLQWTIGPQEFQSANPVFVMIFVPALTLLVYPHIGKWGAPLKRMAVGILLAACSYGAVAWLQWRIEQGSSLSIVWQLIPYFLLTASEVLVSVTGLEYAFTQASPNLKSITSSFWYLTSTFGNLLVVVLTLLFAKDSVSTGMFMTYGLLMLAVGILFLSVIGRLQRASATPTA